MKKKWMCLVMMLLLTLGSGVTVHADVIPTDRDDYKVEYTGGDLISNFSSDELANDIRELQPGDIVIISIELVNSSKNTVDWFMSKEIMESLEDGREASGGGYNSRLVYKSSNGEERLLYSLELGGETEEGEPEGLHQLPAYYPSEGEFFFLERLESGAGSRLELTFELDGESQGNAYLATLAQMQMKFAVEDLGAEAPSEPTYSVKTGDTENPLIWAVAALASGLVILLVAIFRIRGSRGGRKDE